MSDNSLFQVDSITVDGKAIAFVHGTAKIEGAARYTSQVVPSASGPDFESHQRVPTVITMSLQFGKAANPDEIRKINGARIVLKDSQGPRRVIAPRCSFGNLGSIGGGAVDASFNVLEPLQWL